MRLFRRKPANRRLGREHVLEVKLRASKVRAARARMAAVSLGSCFAVLLGGYLGYRAMCWALDEYVYDNQTFVIQEVDIQTDGIIAVDQLRRWTGIKPNANLLALDLALVERNLKLVSAIESVAIERVPPHTLRIRVFEREPIAQINLPRPRNGGGVELLPFHVDPKGYVMLPVAGAHQLVPGSRQFEQLPVLSGINPNEAQPGRRLESAQVQAALQLILSFDRSPMAGLADLRRIDVSSPEVLLVSTGQGSEVTFALKEHERQLARWREVFEAGQRAGKTLASLDLAVSNNIPARWVDATAVPQPISKPVKTPNPRRKHV